MAWRGLHISQAAHLSLDRGRIKIKQFAPEEAENKQQPNEALFFPLEDIAWVIVDNNHSTLSARLIAACMENSVIIIFSDQRQHPCGIALSFHQFHAQTQISRMQIALTNSFKKNIWREIIKAKIINQAQNLQSLQLEDAKTLKNMTKFVQSGDAKNTEARAARFYWSRLFNDFIRSDENDIRNALLNYGYACVRATIARAIVAVGFIPSIGLHHDGRFNAFNMVDDLLEPFRPIVDWAVIEHLRERKKNQAKMNIDDRRSMAAILTRDVVIDKEQLSLLHASERVADKLRRAVEEGEPKLLTFPNGW